MSKAQHTLGTWSIRDDDEDGVVSIVGGSQIVLAKVRTATVEPGDENARLIAAAPELLEALIDLLDEYETVEKRWCDVDLVQKVKSLIAKADGK